MLETIIILSVVIVILIGLLFFSYNYGKKKGEAQVWGFIFENGFKNKVETFKSYNKYVNKGNIVFIGDSITQDFNIYEYFQGYKVYNRGIGGDTTEGLLTRLEESVFELSPSKIFLLIGTNDLALLKTTPEEVANRIQQTIAIIYQKMPQTHIYLQSIYPVNETISPETVLPRTNFDINTINSIIKETKGVTYLDIHSLLIDSNGRLNSKYTIEGLHLNSQGYELVQEVIIKQL